MALQANDDASFPESEAVATGSPSSQMPSFGCTAHDDDIMNTESC